MTTEVWRWIWLALGVVLSLGEIAVAGSFFLLPFGVGALAASAVAFATTSVAATWITFLVVSAVAFTALFPLGRRLDRRSSQRASGVGASRWVGRPAHVLKKIPDGHGETGLVRVDREEWRAESSTGQSIPAGTEVRVVDVAGTRLVVAPSPDDGEVT
jgi:membrane protein implicated in regulation of membrane protease activity